MTYLMGAALAVVGIYSAAYFTLEQPFLWFSFPNAILSFIVACGGMYLIIDESLKTDKKRKGRRK